MKDWLKREVSGDNAEVGFRVHSVYDVVWTYNATVNSGTRFSPYFHMTGRTFLHAQRDQLQERVLEEELTERGAEAVVRDAVAVQRDRRTQESQPKIVEVLPNLKYDVEVAPGVVRPYMIDELKAHVQGIDMPPPGKQKAVRYRPHGEYELWLTYRSPMKEMTHEYRQEIGHRLRRTPMACRWADAKSSVWADGKAFVIEHRRLLHRLHFTRLSCTRIMRRFS
ncbi:hypothetical protein SARC_07161 [Sphaeroforma arctica JP610]|uniref:Uncharacterized protein n=1 Tax=Sphaeroforma arctica JP610 TaxID=667725 RepID=A0A0L0FV20_9EUKA|nr:hypothetical protein SARC_07161 [Sphaeroforma arctica JP610]KNC80484.1 hypothetical protein SARC_07161 [Sphaeroforma arctica JP610]|eukprot:XP_014154386.1 hypothetical protein SARC_07161 [Sphaeroforma arctica JP610]